jgi:hypothetical protein
MLHTAYRIDTAKLVGTCRDSRKPISMRHLGAVMQSGGLRDPSSPVLPSLYPVDNTKARMVHILGAIKVGAVLDRCNTSGRLHYYTHISTSGINPRHILVHTFVCR